VTGAVAVPAGRRRPPADRFDRRLLPSMMLGAILNPINSSIIAVALVPIALAFGAPAAQTAWLVSALYVATAIGQPVVGRGGQGDVAAPGLGSVGRRAAPGVGGGHGGRGVSSRGRFVRR